MKKISYRQILKDAFKFTFSSSKLSLLALLAFLTMDIGIYNSLVKYFNLLVNDYSSVINLLTLKLYILDILHLRYWFNLFDISAWLSIAIFIFIAILFILFYYLGVHAQISIIEALKYYLQNKLDKISVNHLFAKSHPKFWRVLIINIVRQLAIVVLGGIIGVPLLVYLYKLNIGAFILFLIVLLFILLLITFVSLYAMYYVIFYDHKLLEAVKKGEDLFVRHFFTSLEMVLILFILEIFVSFLIYSLSKFLLLSILLAIYAQGALLLTSFIILIVIFFVFSIYLLLWYYIFQLISWSLLFLLLQDNESDNAKVVKVFQYIKIKIKK